MLRGELAPHSRGEVRLQMLGNDFGGRLSCYKRLQGVIRRQVQCPAV